MQDIQRNPQTVEPQSELNKTAEFKVIRQKLECNTNNGHLEYKIKIIYKTIRKHQVHVIHLIKDL